MVLRVNFPNFLKPGVIFYLGFLALLHVGCSSDPGPDPNASLPALTLTDQNYGTDLQQKMDVFLPEGRNLKETPLLIYLHGGAWIEGSKEEFLQFKPLLELHFPDYAFASIDYRLYNFSTGQNTFPTQEEDVTAAIAYIKTKFKEWSIEGDLVLSGASAGGHLALLQALKAPDIGPFQAVVAFFPPTDLASLYSNSPFTAQGLELLLQGSPTSKPEIYAESSPISFITTGSVPVIFFHGTTDQVVPISQSESFVIKLKEKGVTHQLVKIEGQGHGFSTETYPPLIEAAANFINDLP